LREGGKSQGSSGGGSSGGGGGKSPSTLGYISPSMAKFPKNKYRRASGGGGGGLGMSLPKMGSSRKANSSVPISGLTPEIRRKLNQEAVQAGREPRW
jgi:hypothetical protein